MKDGNKTAFEDHVDYNFPTLDIQEKYGENPIVVCLVTHIESPVPSEAAVLESQNVMLTARL